MFTGCKELDNGCAINGLTYFGYQIDDYGSFVRAFNDFKSIYEKEVGRLHPELPINLEIDQLFNQIDKVDLRQERPPTEAVRVALARYWRITLPTDLHGIDIWGPCLDHGIAAVGFDDKVKIKNTICDRETKGALLIRNSWGTGWGDEGYGWLPYDYVLRGLGRDWWSLLKSEWIDTGKFGI